MKAFVYRRYGSPDELKMEEVATPIPTDNQILIKIMAVSINGSDREKLIGKPYYVRLSGLFKPKDLILGSDIAGRVEAVGKNITEFKAGDDVFGEIPGYHSGFAEYVCTSGKTMSKKPANLTFEEASAIPQAGVIALQGMRDKGQVAPGQHVLINGAGGSAGSFAVQLAKLFGAEVTGVDHGSKEAFVRSLGADHFIDYTRQDFTKSGQQFDLILDVIAHRSLFAYPRALKPNGTYYVVGGAVGTVLQIVIFGSLVKRFSDKNLRLLAVPQNRKDLEAITAYCESGEIKPVIDGHYSFSETREAMRYVSGGHAKGKVVITVADA